MSTHTTHGAPKELHDGVHNAPGGPQLPTTPADLELANLLDYADSFIWAIQGAGQDRALAVSQPVLWNAACTLFEQSDRDIRRLGYAMALSAIIATPQALEHAARTLRKRLSANIPVTWADELDTIRSDERAFTIRFLHDYLDHKLRNLRAQIRPNRSWRTPGRYQWKRQAKGGQHDH
jgi:hypothetical protein